MDDHGLGPFPGLIEFEKVLRVMKGIASCPIDKTRVGIGDGSSVEIDRLAGIEQAIRDAGDGNGAAGRISKAVHDRHVAAPCHRSDTVHRAVAEAEAAARQADLPEHGGKRDQRKIRLFAVIGALQRPGSAQHHPARRDHLPERFKLTDRNAADIGRPGQRFHDPIGFAVEICAEFRASGRVSIEERHVGATGDQRLMGKPEHDCGVAVGARRDPGRLEPFRCITGKWRDDHEARAVRLCPFDKRRHVVMPGTSGCDAPILRIEPAESNHHIRMLCDALPTRRRMRDSARVADDMGQDDIGRTPAVVPDLIGEPTGRGEKTAHLRAGMMQPPGTRPSVGSAEHRGGTVIAVNALQFGRHQVERLVPADSDHLVTAAPVAVALALEEARADIRTVDTLIRIDQRGPGADHVRIGAAIAKGSCLGQPAVVDTGFKGTPVAEAYVAFARQGHSAAAARFTLKP